ncbi:restriction endonuclease [Pseudomonas sp. DTU_2021_1001937_2_SI_NGA_ILE_001]|uniref:restriction endonuclease n=1 Tax=Pseudomonas sp. DTU_2021_1001937_2_SI_NGA_ILE_001 TaxID=3077589 RepID=UPI0028FC26FB|nr:restriction endonuclease [Pseudomonas sp. DTU_2021_1001937_2_SI_NGA_ILE_001]WNW10164.1 restriction endonuclease [Pseudomonas sp. DTU_2021_1001937_2_SI_NGA_ILE_001]
MSPKKISPFTALLQLASVLPWWANVALAITSAALLHALAATPVGVDPRHIDKALISSAFKGMATFGQFFLPLVFASAAVASFVGRRKRRQLLESLAKPGGNKLVNLTWREFELAVGEALRRQGFVVQENRGAGPDGGVDLRLQRDGETYLVQCKHWRAQQVGVAVVRELYGVMAAEGAVGGYVVTSGRFTRAAEDFGHGRNLQLVDGAVLQRWIDERVEPSGSPVTAPEAPMPPAQPAMPAPPAPAPAPAPVSTMAPGCPHCKKPMLMKTARTGPNAGGQFWGCSDYPQCRGIRAYRAPLTPTPPVVAKHRANQPHQ